MRGALETHRRLSDLWVTEALKKRPWCFLLPGKAVVFQCSETVGKCLYDNSRHPEIVSQTGRLLKSGSRVAGHFTLKVPVPLCSEHQIIQDQREYNFRLCNFSRGFLYLFFSFDFEYKSQTLQKICSMEHFYTRKKENNNTSTIQREFKTPVVCHRF